MPRILDNLQPASSLLPALQETLELSSRADFCIGYFNLRGWGGLAPYVDKWDETRGPCRVLIGMQRLPDEDLKTALSLKDNHSLIDQQAANRLKTQLAQQLRDQLSFGAPSNADERTLRQLVNQLKIDKVRVKLFLRHPLHAKLYLLYRDDPINPIVGYMGSSNLTFAGLASQGELNIDVLDSDATFKLRDWFEERWNDRFCVDITDELIKLIEESWAREDLIDPYHIYLKMAYHLSNEARAGLSEFNIPKVFGDRLFDYQAAAVKIAAHHLNKRNGVLIGDVVGLGKTLMATAVARIFEDDYNLETLIICPPNLVPMWEDYAHEYQLRARVLSLGAVQRELPSLKRYRIVVIDESHNLRNREGRRYRAIQEYIRENDSKCILLSATPYNKAYDDLANQLRLFVDDSVDLGIRPERYLRELGEVEFSSRHQASTRSLAAFGFSEYADDWRDLMRLYLVRRTRGFIQDNYAETDADTGRKFLTYEDGSQSFFPTRLPKTAKFSINDSDPNDQYAKLYSEQVRNVIENLHLPRYGLGNYIVDNPAVAPTHEEQQRIDGLSRAGKRLIGYSRVNLFKRLESSGSAFLQSVERHILRNHVFLYALANDLPLPLGTQDTEMLDTRFTDEDADSTAQTSFEDDEGGQDTDNSEDNGDESSGKFEERAAATYAQYEDRYKNRFGWLRAELFKPDLARELGEDTAALTRVLNSDGPWNPARDAKLEALQELLSKTYPDQKVIVFSQFADTVNYLTQQLSDRGVEKLAGVSGNSEDPTQLAWRFSPVSNNRRDQVTEQDELRVLIATDVLSEGQNLQDCHIVVNYDLPWAIIRLIQRAGRVDRIGQTAEDILCHSFLPADGVERIINLRGRVRQRLRQNAEVVGAGETFFEDDADDQTIVNLYTEQEGILDGDPDTEVDLASHAYEIWNNATRDNPQLAKAVSELPDVVLSSRHHKPLPNRPEGVLVFMRTAEDNDALAYVDREGRSITESQFEILSAAECTPGTPAQPHSYDHHALVSEAVKHLVSEERQVGGQLGRPSGARYRTYTRLKDYADAIKGQLFDLPELHRVLDDIYRYPLRSNAIDSLNRQMRSGIGNEQLADLVIALRNENRLSYMEDQTELAQEPRIICSLGLFDTEDDAQ